MQIVLVFDRLGSLQIVSSSWPCWASCLPMRLYSLLIIPILANGKNFGSADGLLKSVPQWAKLLKKL
jgi:hypothetical protein